MPRSRLWTLSTRVQLSSAKLKTWCQQNFFWKGLQRLAKPPSEAVVGRVQRFGYTHYKNYIQCREKKNMQKHLVLHENYVCFALFYCFGAENLFFRDSVFLHSVISFGTGAVNRKLQNEEKKNREKINFRHQNNKKVQNTSNFHVKLHVFDIFV